MSSYLTDAEYEYRRQRIARDVAASRGGRSRSDWMRRLAATDPARPRRVR